MELLPWVLFLLTFLAMVMFCLLAGMYKDEALRLNVELDRAVWHRPDPEFAAEFRRHEPRNSYDPGGRP